MSSPPDNYIDLSPTLRLSEYTNPRNGNELDDCAAPLAWWRAMRKLHCHTCEVLVAEVAVGSRLRNGMAAYCARCNDRLMTAAEVRADDRTPPPGVIKTLLWKLRK